MTLNMPFFPSRQDSAKRKLLVYYFSHLRARHYLRELASLLGADPANLSRYLRTLESEGIFRSEVSGNQKYFSLNPSYPLYEEFRSIISKTSLGRSSAPGQVCRPAYVIAGPNGAGKTTFAKTFLKQYMGCETFVNADLIAAGISPLAPDKAQLRAGKILLEEIRRTARKKVDFGFETTLSGRSYIHLFRELIGEGFELHLFFLWIPNIAISIKRIKDRVKRGGHDIPDEVVKRRFHRGIHNLFNIYRHFLKSWTMFDNSGTSPKLIAYEEEGERIVRDNEKFSVIKKIAGVT